MLILAKKFITALRNPCLFLPAGQAGGRQAVAIKLKSGENIFNSFRSNKGFTLIEVLVSMVIITAMTTLFLTNYHSTNKRAELTLTAQKMSGDIRMAQNKSLGSEEYGDDNIPTGGWGVHIDKGADNYIIFADDDGNFIFDVGEDDISLGAEIINYSNSVSVATTTVNGVSVDIIDIVFFPPNPITYINGLSGAMAMITLEEDSNFSTSTIEINYFGLIDNM